jgi:hypothetical protein
LSIGQQQAGTWTSRRPKPDEDLEPDAKVSVDYRSERPGASRKITFEDLPKPGFPLTLANRPKTIPRPPDALPKAPRGFQVSLNGCKFPYQYHGDIFAAVHGSWNRSVPTGYEVIRVHLCDGKSNGEYEDFLTGFITEKGAVWGRPVGVTVARDGSLLVSDDVSKSVWRVTHEDDRWQHIP